MKITTTTNLLITLGTISAVLPIFGLIVAACLLLAAFICAIVAVSQGQPGSVRLLISAILAGPIAVAVNLVALGVLSGA